MTTNTAPKGGYYASIDLPYEQEFELYHNSLSNCSQKVRICLAEHKIPYKSHHVHLIETGAYETCAPSYKAINPGATVPTLVHNGHPIYESSDQIQYIGKVCPRSRDKAAPTKEEETLIKQWIKFTSITDDPIRHPNAMYESLGHCIPGISILLFVTMIAEIPYSQILWGLRHHPNKERPLAFLAMKFLGVWVFRLIPMVRNLVTKSIGAIRKHLRYLETHFQQTTTASNRMDDGPGTTSSEQERHLLYLCGSDFTLADVGLMACLSRMQLLDMDFLWTRTDEFPLVKAYFERLMVRESYQTAIREHTLPIMQRGADKIKDIKRTRPWFRKMVEGE